MTAAPPEVLRGDLYGEPPGIRYAFDMARTEFMGIETARKQLGERVDRARDDELHTVLTRHGMPAAILVNPEWYRAARNALNDPVPELPVVAKPRKRADAENAKGDAATA